MVKIITVCGSTKYRKEIKEWAWAATKEGQMVLFSPFAKEEYPDLEAYRDTLEQIHFLHARKRI